MGYGRSCPTVYIPMTFVCRECSVSVTIQIDAGKDYIYEDTLREGERDMVVSCNWLLIREENVVLCSHCRFSHKDGG